MKPQRTPDSLEVESEGRAAPASSETPGTAPFATPLNKPDEYTDGRRPGDWESKYPKEARRCINHEACFLGLLLILLIATSAVLLGFSGQTATIPVGSLAVDGNQVTPVWTLDFRLLIIFSVGCLGGTTFSVKWLLHAAAKRKWHLDRRYWRFFVPIIGGVYACVVMALFDGGLIAGQSGTVGRSDALTAAFAFLIGYFSDGVSGLLSNIANAVFGTLEKK